GPRRIADLLDDRDLPLRRFLERVVPREHEAVAFDDRIGAHPGLAVRALAVRDVGARARAVELPAVEGTGEEVAVDPAAVREVRAEMRAERVLQVECGRGVAPQNE